MAASLLRIRIWNRVSDGAIGCGFMYFIIVCIHPLNLVLLHPCAPASIDRSHLESISNLVKFAWSAARDWSGETLHMLQEHKNDWTAPSAQRREERRHAVKCDPGSLYKAYGFASFGLIESGFEAYASNRARKRPDSEHRKLLVLRRRV